MNITNERFIELESSIEGYYLGDYKKIFDEITQQGLFAYRKVILFKEDRFMIIGQGIWLKSGHRDNVEMAMISSEEVAHMSTWLGV